MRSHPSTQPPAQLAGICDSVSAEAAEPLKMASAWDGGWQLLANRLNNPGCRFNEVLNLRLSPLAVAVLLRYVVEMAALYLPPVVAPVGALHSHGHREFLLGPAGRLLRVTRRSGANNNGCP